MAIIHISGAGQFMITELELVKFHNINDRHDTVNPNNLVKIKISNYNYFIRYDNDFYLGYNFLYRSILKIPVEAFPEINYFLQMLSTNNIQLEDENSPTVKISTQWLEALREAQFIIQGDLDELSLIKFRYYRSLFASDYLSLVILPTLWCNFECPYCFEIKKPTFMSPEVEDALVRWVENSFKHKRHIHVGWFGGEPLLAKKVIIRLTDRLQKLSSNIGASYTASLTTNGFFLDQEFQSFIPKSGIKSVQVTFDGDKEDHDTLRRQSNGQGSFDRILQNIISFCENVPDCKLTLRINCGDRNYDKIEKLIERFPPIVKARATVFFRWIWANKASGFRDFACRNRGVKPFMGLAKLYETSNISGWKTGNPHNHFLGGYCEVDYLDHYNIDPEGNVFLCSHTFEKSESIGSILQDRDIVRFDAIGTYTRWYSVNPFDDTECVNCQLLPICLGGCRKSRFEGMRECIEERKSIDLFVKNLVEEQLMSANYKNRSGGNGNG